MKYTTMVSNKDVLSSSEKNDLYAERHSKNNIFFKYFVMLHLLGVRILPGTLNRRTTAALLSNVEFAFIRRLLQSSEYPLEIIYVCCLQFQQVLQFCAEWAALHCIET